MSPERVGVAAWIALVALQFVWYFVIAPPAGGSPWIAIAVYRVLEPLASRRSAAVKNGLGEGRKPGSRVSVKISRWFGTISR